MDSRCAHPRRRVGCSRGRNASGVQRSPALRWKAAPPGRHLRSALRVLSGVCDLIQGRCRFPRCYAPRPAGGAAKNRLAHETLHLRPGRYVAYFVSDDSHAPDDWNAVPATDLESWGLTLRVADRVARGALRPFEYQPVPEAETIVSMIGIGDNANRSTGFTLKRPLDVRICALGESSDQEMVDYAWIVNALDHKRVWIMRYDNTEPAGGADKNRVFDGTLHLDPGSYFVRYKSDGSHSYNDWNAAPPAEERYWGVSVFPASGHLNRADVTPFERSGGTGTPVARLVRMGDDENARASFQLPDRKSTR